MNEQARRTLAVIPNDLISVAEAARVLKVSKMTVYRLVHAEEIRAWQVGRSMRLSAKDVADWFRDSTTIKWEKGS